MPDMGQVRIAAYQVMREFGLVGTTKRRVRAQMKANGVRPGSDRDLPNMVRAFRREQESIAQLPTAAVKMAEAFASEIWKLALATLGQRELQRGRADPEPKKARRGEEPPPKGLDRITVLQRAIEYILRPDAKGDNLILAPVSGRELFRRLTDKQAELTDVNHIDRDLRAIQALSKVLYRLPGKSGKWWLKNRPLPPGYGDRKVAKGYVRRGTALSQTRMDNRPLMENTIAVMIHSRHRWRWQEIANKLRVPQEGREKFRQMLRNHLRARTPRFTRDDDGYFSVIGRGAGLRERHQLPDRGPQPASEILVFRNSRDGG